MLKKSFRTVALGTKISKFTSFKGKWWLSKDEQFISAHCETSFIEILQQMSEIGSFQYVWIKFDTQAYLLDLHPTQQPLLGVCFFWPQLGNVTDHFDQYIMKDGINKRNIFKNSEQRFRARAVTRPSCRLKLAIIKAHTVLLL